MKINILLVFILLTNTVFSQKKTSNLLVEDTDSLPYTSYRYRPILFADIGFTAAPLDLKYSFSDEIKQISYRHNNKMMLGIGASHSWFAFRIGLAVVGNLKPVSKFGKSNYFDIGLRFSIKHFYSEIGFRYYTNYSIIDAYKWDTTFTKSIPNDTRQNIDVYNVAAKMWYINNKHFKMDAFTGNRGVFNKSTFTWYLGGRLDSYGINNKSGDLISRNLQDTTNSKTASTAFNAVELGVLPGVGYATRYKTFQFGIMAAIGPMVQLKSYTINGSPNGLGGIVARYDFKMTFGYNIPRCFVMFIIDVDTKSINFDKLKYNQTFYSMKMQVGYRFNEKLPKKKRKK
ncbi:MAG: hypothetical protein M9916_03705 [Crocinitomicaceae bacterium]|nr:hypothetical protein [Crocinitomicaceae bacterium]